MIPTKAFCKKSTLFGLLQLTVFVCDSTRSFKDEVPFDFPNFCLVTTCCCCCKISFLIALVFLLGSMVMADTLCPMLSIVPRADLVPICDVGRCNSVLASNAPSGFSLLMRICVLPSCGRAYTKYRVCNLCEYDITICATASGSRLVGNILWKKLPGFITIDKQITYKMNLTKIEIVYKIDKRFQNSVLYFAFYIKYS